MAEGLVLRGTMRAHTDMVTAIATPIDNSDIIVIASRDKSIILWNLTKEDKIYGVPRRRLTGHSHCVEDVVLSSDGQIALSDSWVGELRLWVLQAGVSARRFVGHTKDVLSVAFSIDNRQIVSASRDRMIKLWNTVGECKFTISDLEAHQDWVSCVRFSPNTLQPTIVSASWDKTVKVWNLTNCKIKNTLAGHTSTAVPTPTPPSSRKTVRVSAVAAAHASPILPPRPVARAFIGSKRRNMMERKSLGLFMLLFILLASQEMVVPTEANPCESQSRLAPLACSYRLSFCILKCRMEHGGLFVRSRCIDYRCFCTYNSVNQCN